MTNTEEARMSRREDIEPELDTLFVRRDLLIEMVAVVEPGSPVARWLNEEVVAGSMRAMILLSEATDEEE